MKVIMVINAYSRILLFAIDATSEDQVEGPRLTAHAQSYRQEPNARDQANGSRKVKSCNPPHVCT